MDLIIKVDHINRTRVKICGITNLEDAKVAIEAGADAIGLVFYENSPRYVTISTATQIVNNIAPFINCVGLFVDADEAYVREVLNQVAIDTLQLHGQEPEQACALYNRPYIKAVRMSEGINLFEQIEKYSSASALLLDTYVKDVPGGTGNECARKVHCVSFERNVGRVVEMERIKKGHAVNGEG